VDVLFIVRMNTNRVSILRNYSHYPCKHAVMCQNWRSSGMFTGYVVLFLHGHIIQCLNITEPTQKQNIYSNVRWVNVIHKLRPVTITIMSQMWTVIHGVKITIMSQMWTVIHGVNISVMSETWTVIHGVKIAIMSQMWTVIHGVKILVISETWTVIHGVKISVMSETCTVMHGVEITVMSEMCTVMYGGESTE